MTILILSRENATYSQAEKTFTYSLDKQLDENIKSLRLESVTFRPSTMTTYPHGIFMCSRALAELSMRHHATVLRDVNHRHKTNVLACLHKASNDVLYHLASPLRIMLDRRAYIRDIDIFFTAPDGTVLDGEYVPVSTAGPQLSDLETMHDDGSGNLLFFMDCDLASSYRKQDDSQAAQGDTVKQWVARYPDDESVAFNQSSVDGLILTTFDDESHVVCVTTNPAGGAWESMVETDVGFDLPDSGSLFLLWETDSTPNSYETMVQNNHFFNLVLHNSNLSYRSEDGGTQHPVIFNILASTSYLLEIKWIKGATVGANFACDMTLNATKLVLNNNTDFTGSTTTSMRTSGSKRRIVFSTAQTGMDSKVSSCILLSGHDADQRATCKAYLEKRWRNASTTPEVDPNAVDSSFLCEIRV